MDNTSDSVNNTKTASEHSSYNKKQLLIFVFIMLAMLGDPEKEAFGI